MQADCDIVNIVQWQTKAKMYYINNKDSNSISPRKYFTRILWFFVIYWLKRLLKEFDIVRNRWFQCQLIWKEILNCFGKCTKSTLTLVALLKIKQFNRIIILLTSVAIGNRTLLKNGLFWNDKKLKDWINKAYWNTNW